MQFIFFVSFHSFSSLLLSFSIVFQWFVLCLSSCLSFSIVSLVCFPDCITVSPRWPYFVLEQDGSLLPFSDKAAAAAASPLTLS
jgi:hypothetical protein